MKWRWSVNIRQAEIIFFALFDNSYENCSRLTKLKGWNDEGNRAGGEQINGKIQITQSRIQLKLILIPNDLNSQF